MSRYDAAFSACGHESSPVASNADGGDSNASSSSSSSSKSENYNDGYRGGGGAAAARDNEQFNNSKIRQIDGDHPHTRWLQIFQTIVKAIRKVIVMKWWMSWTK